MNAHEPLLRRALELSLEFLRGVDARPAGARAGREELLAALGGPLPERGEDGVAALERLARSADAGLVASAGPRYFGFVTGAGLPAAVAADWLTSAWNQNVSLNVLSPAGAAIEEVAAGWLTDVLGLPPGCSVGFVTGGQTANFTCLAAARNEVLRRAGWDVDRDGLIGAPPLRVIAGAEVHISIYAALRMLGLGAGRVELVDADAQGRMVPRALGDTLARGTGPAIVCAQAGNVNSGAFDPLLEIVPIAHDAGAWVHVDGAFGLWAAASPSLRGLVAGHRGADSWATDAHKWLNVPYDCGIALTAHPDAHRAATTASAAYLALAAGERNPFEWVPKLRGEGAPFLSTSRCGRWGATESRRSSSGALRWPAAWPTGFGRRRRVLNDVVLNQVLVQLSAIVRGRSLPRCKERGRAGSAVRAGRGWTRCASRYRAGPRPRRTWTAPCAPSSPRPRRTRSHERPLPPRCHALVALLDVSCCHFGIVRINPWTA